MFFNKKRGGGGKGGFTLIELLVVIAIIGILSGVVLASLNSARQKGRDVKRVADVTNLRPAFELYFDDNGSKYPTTIGALVTGGYISATPLDPNGSAYSYAALGSGANCTSYHLGATLENTSHTSLSNDADAAAGTACTGSAADFAGTDPIFDVKP